MAASASRCPTGPRSTRRTRSSGCQARRRRSPIRANAQAARTPDRRWPRKASASCRTSSPSRPARPWTSPTSISIFHNAFSVSPGNQFDLGLYRKGASKSHTFSTPGVVHVYCNIHQDMAGYVLVLPSARAVVTGADGGFRFTDVRPGRQNMKVWHPMTGEIEVAIDLQPGAYAPVGRRTRRDALPPRDAQEQIRQGLSACEERCRPVLMPTAGQQSDRRQDDGARRRGQDADVSVADAVGHGPHAPAWQRHDRCRQRERRHADGAGSHSRCDDRSALAPDRRGAGREARPGPERTHLPRRERAARGDASAWRWRSRAGRRDAPPKRASAPIWKRCRACSPATSTRRPPRAAARSNRSRRSPARRRCSPKPASTPRRCTIPSAELAKSLDARIAFLFDFQGALLSRSDQPDGPDAGRSFAEIPWVRSPIEEQATASAFIVDVRTTPGLYLVTAAPVVQGAGAEARVNGAIGAAYELNDARARELARVAGADVAFLANFGARDAAPNVQPVAATERLSSGSGRLLAEMRRANPGIEARLFTEGKPYGPFEFLAPGDAGDTFIGTLLPIVSSRGEPIAAVLLARSKTAELAAFHSLRRSLLVAGLLVLLASMPLSLLVARRISRPIRQLAEGAEQIGRGQLDVTLPAGARRRSRRADPRVRRHGRGTAREGAARRGARPLSVDRRHRLRDRVHAGRGRRTPARTAVREPLRDPRAGRRRRHGRGVPRERSRAGRRGGAEVPARPERSSRRPRRCSRKKSNSPA